MTDWVVELRASAGELEKAAKLFEDFHGADDEDHAEQLREIAKQFRKDADEYLEFNK